MKVIKDGVIYEAKEGSVILVALLKNGFKEVIDEEKISIDD